MAIRRSFGRTLIAAGIFAAVAVPTAGVAYAATGSHHPGTPAHHQPVPPQHHQPAPPHHQPTPPHHSVPIARVLTTRVPGAEIRTRPTTSRSAKTLTTFRRPGSAVKVICYTSGTSVSHDNVWYRTTSPKTGYIAGRWLNIKKEPVAGVARCA
jgi:hypothetical protein